MPNWCVNYMKVSAKPETIESIFDFINSSQAFSKLYNLAFNASIKLFVAGQAGILRAVTKIDHPIYSELFKQQNYEVGEDNEVNRAFTRFVDMLILKTPMTEDVCNEILALFKQSKLANIHWENIPEHSKQIITETFQNQSIDWFCRIGKKCNVADEWNSFSNNVREGDGSLILDAYSLIPSPIDVAINGFNGRLLPKVTSSYDWNINYLGTKLSSFEVLIVNQSVDSLTIEFDTAWSPSTEVSQALSKRYQCYIEHIYAEQGCCYCGWQEFQNGTLMGGLTNDVLLFSEEDEDGFVDVIGPSYVMALSHFGG